MSQPPNQGVVGGTVRQGPGQPWDPAPGPPNRALWWRRGWVIGPIVASIVVIVVIAATVSLLVLSGDDDSDPSSTVRAYLQAFSDSRRRTASASETPMSTSCSPRPTATGRSRGVNRDRPVPRLGPEEQADAVRRGRLR